MDVPQVQTRPSVFDTSRGVSMALLAGMVLGLFTLAGCRAPIGAKQVSARQAYRERDAHALSSGRIGIDTSALLHRHGLLRLSEKRPEQALRQLHQVALESGQRDLLLALAELSYVAAERFRVSVRRGEPERARDYYLGTAVYAWLFLFGEGREPVTGAFDRRFRVACDYYNDGLGLGLLRPGETNGAVRWEEGPRRLPVGSLELRVSHMDLSPPLEELEELLWAGRYRVRGLDLQHRQSGIGAPLIAVGGLDAELGIRRCSPATVLLRLEGNLADFSAGKGRGGWEVYSVLGDEQVDLGGLQQVPLETDLTTPFAYTLNQSMVWDLGRLQFLAPEQKVKSRLMTLGPVDATRIPVVLVHGTFSSPVAWAGLNNALMADPQLRRHYQFWHFLYGSGNPLLVSARELRAALTEQVRQLDPEGREPALHQMVVIGHSQGGLLAKLTATDTGDHLWRELSSTPWDALEATEAQRDALRELLFLEALPFVRRVVFISTPHRGSYMVTQGVRRMFRRLMSLPGAVVAQGQELMALTRNPAVTELLDDRIPTSIDGMSSRNPVLLALAELPVAPSVQAHSIIAIRGRAEPPEGRDGVVAYRSAQATYAVSECIVRSGHSCQNLPPTIEEVRRILYEHLVGVHLGADTPLQP